MRNGTLCGLAAAVTFGASVPVASRMVGDVDPQLLAGLLYGGAAVALARTWRISSRRSPALCA